MIDKTHQLSVRQQSQLIQINRSTLYYKSKEISSTDLSLMRLIDEIHLDYPFMGSRMIRDMLQRQGHQIGRRKVRRLMRLMGIHAMLDQHISTQDDIDHIYESFDKNEKEAAQAKIITELKSRLEDKMLNIKASLKPASDDIIPLNINTSLNFHKNTIIPPRFSGYVKGHPTSHKSSVSENPPEENPDTEYPTIKTNTEHSQLREDQLNPFKKKY